MFDNLKISGKLVLGFGVVLALLAFVSLFNVSNANKISQQVELVKDFSYSLATETIDTINQAEKILGLVLNASEAATQAPLIKAEENKVDVDDALQGLAKSLPTESDTYHELIHFMQVFNACFESGKQMTNFAVEQDFIQFVSAREIYQNNFVEFEASANNLKEMVSKTLYDDLNEITVVSDSNVRSSGYLTLAGLALGIILATVISRNISRPMKNVVHVISKIGDGDLNQRIGGKRGDEIGQVSAAIDDMATKLCHMVEQLRQSTSEFSAISSATANAADSVDNTAKNQGEGIESISVSIQQIGASIDSVTQHVDTLSISASDSTTSSLEMAASIEEVAENSLQLSKSVDEIGSSISEMASTINQVAGNAEILKQSSVSTASTVEEMDNNIKQVEEHAKETSQTTADVRRDAEEGKLSVDKTIAGINQIRTSSSTTSDAVKVLADKVKDIGSILAVITEVTEQTNLLALNAAIISAQAGVHGRGFAVVAEEIRELSERTNNSTREIEAVIADIQKETARAVESIQQTESSIVEGEELSLKSGEMLDKIVTGAQGSASRVDQIVRAAAEQAQASHMMRTAVESVSEMAGQIALATKEQDQGAKSITAASQLIAELTEHLKNSTREQSQTSSSIGQSMEKMNDLVQQIKVACYQQKDGSKNIVNAMEDIKDSTRKNITSVESLNSAVERLQGEISVLQKEMSAFKVADVSETVAERADNTAETEEPGTAEEEA